MVVIMFNIAQYFGVFAINTILSAVLLKKFSLFTFD